MNVFAYFGDRFDAASACAGRRCLSASPRGQGSEALAQPGRHARHRPHRFRPARRSGPAAAVGADAAGARRGGATMTPMSRTAGAGGAEPPSRPGRKLGPIADGTGPQHRAWLPAGSDLALTLMSTAYGNRGDLPINVGGGAAWSAGQPNCCLRRSCSRSGRSARWPWWGHPCESCFLNRRFPPFVASSRSGKILPSVHPYRKEARDAPHADRCQAPGTAP